MPKVVSYTLQPVTAVNCAGLHISSTDGGVTLTSEAYFGIKDENGIVRMNTNSILTLTPAQRTAILNFITSNHVPDVNTKEGL